MNWRVFSFVVVLAIAGPPVAAELGGLIGEQMRGGRNAPPGVIYGGASRAAMSDPRELLHFWRPNCPVSAKTQLRVRALQAQGYRIRSINTLRERELSRRYQINATPTFITIEDGVVVHRVAGGRNAGEIVELLQEH